MSCQILGCDVPNLYHYNPLCAPLHEFHGRVVECFSQMPERGKGKELALRIALVVCSPFAYLALGLIDILGRITDTYWKNRHIEEIENKKVETEKSKAANEKPNSEIDKTPEAETEIEKIDPELEMLKYKAKMEQKKYDALEEQKKKDAEIENEKETAHLEAMVQMEKEKALMEEAKIQAAIEHEKAQTLMEKKKIEDELLKEVMKWLPCPWIINALGGAEKVKSLPKLDKEVSGPEEMSDPVMILNKNNQTGLFFRVIERSKDEESGKLKQHSRVLAIGWNPHISCWLGTDEKNPLLSNRNKVHNTPYEETFIGDRIERLVNGKGIGKMELLPGIPFIIPEDKTPYKPQQEDSYLKGNELHIYLQTTTAIYYEKEVIPGEREFVLA